MKFAYETGNDETCYIEVVVVVVVVVVTVVVVVAYTIDLYVHFQQDDGLRFFMQHAALINKDS